MTWAKDVLKAYFENRQPETLANEDLKKRAACFVSLHNSDGSLRGCIGTILPTKPSLEDEIKDNALSAAFKDPRFDPLQPEGLDDLTITVDVLGEPEGITSAADLDPKKYGVIVSAGNKRGVLLPDLEGVDTIEQQLHIAMHKAGIPVGAPIAVHRFKVNRYH